MNNAELYNKYNKLQVRDAEDILRKFNQIHQISPSINCTLIDIGSGCGKVMAKVMLAKTKINFGELTGFDISQEMVYYANDKYGNEKIQFLCKDLIGKKANIDNWLGKADIVTSFYCIHWEGDLR